MIHGHSYKKTENLRENIYMSAILLYIPQKH
jgi:hypothetical protein